MWQLAVDAAEEIAAAFSDQLRMSLRASATQSSTVRPISAAI
jgi:hypothetical protein